MSAPGNVRRGGENGTQPASDGLGAVFSRHKREKADAQGAPASSTASRRLLDFDLGTGGFELFLEFFGFVFGDTFLDGLGRTVDQILNGSVLPAIAEAVLARMAEGEPIASIRVGASKQGQFKYTIK